jgi:hypothetical protein
MGAGGRFTKIGGGGVMGGAGKGFKKVGVAVGKEGEKKVEVVKVEGKEKEVLVEAVPEKSVENMKKKEEDTVMADQDEEDAVTWEEYDFTKPTGCDHSSCSGCKTDGIWSNEWVAV